MGDPTQLLDSVNALLLDSVNANPVRLRDSVNAHKGEAVTISTEEPDGIASEGEQTVFRVASSQVER